MNNVLIILRNFLVLVPLQVLVLGQLVLFGWSTPMVYPLFVLLMPLGVPQGLQLLLAFSAGLVVDAFDQTGGMHAFAAVFLTFIRPILLRVLQPKEGYQPDDRPAIASLGFTWFLTYSVVGLLLHHLVFYVVEVMSIAHWQFMLWRIVASVPASLAIAILLQFVMYPLRQRRML